MQQDISEIVFRQNFYLNYSGHCNVLWPTIFNMFYKNRKAVVFISMSLNILINAIGWITTWESSKFIARQFCILFCRPLRSWNKTPIIIVGNYLIDRNLWKNTKLFWFITAARPEDGKLPILQINYKEKIKVDLGLLLPRGRCCAKWSDNKKFDLNNFTAIILTQ